MVLLSSFRATNKKTPKFLSLTDALKYLQVKQVCDWDLLLNNPVIKENSEGKC